VIKYTHNGSEQKWPCLSANAKSLITTMNDQITNIWHVRNWQLTLLEIQKKLTAIAL